jgi:oligopeptide transport system ATP-binding protein
MHLGRIVILADRVDVHDKPQHPYTQALLSAVPIPDPVAEEKWQRIIIEGDVPNPANPPKGCNSNTRCPQVMDICYQEDPAYIDIGGGHYCACHLVT